MDRISLDNLRLDCRVGVTEEERRSPQKVLLDVGLFLDLARPAASGRLADTVDYREARRQISEFVSGGRFRLLETLAEGVASLVLKNFDADRVTVRVRKEKYSAEPSIGVEIERERED
jgi:FolB domain-containing protein